MTVDWIGWIRSHIPSIDAGSFERSGRWVSTSFRGLVSMLEQGKGGKQGGAMMPLLCSLGQRATLWTVQNRFFEKERLMTFLDVRFGTFAGPVRLLSTRLKILHPSIYRSPLVLFQLLISVMLECPSACLILCQLRPSHLEFSLTWTQGKICVRDYNDSENWILFRQ